MRHFPTAAVSETLTAFERIPLVPFGQVLLILALWIACVPSRAAVYQLGDGDSTQVIGEDLHIKTRYSDTLYDIARQYGLGSEEIISANPGVDPWLPGEGTSIVIPGRRILPPAPRDGIVVNLPEHRLYYFPKPKKHGKRVVVTYPVSIGKMDWKTPLGLTRVIQKIKQPYWYPPESVRKEHAEEGDPLPKLVPPGPNNPLGAFAMRLDVHPGDYLIHGTNNPLAVGMPVTHGCIRMYPEDVAALFPTVRVGTKVHLINDPVKVAYVDGELLLEVHAPVDAQGQTIQPELAQFEQLLNEALGTTTTAINWDYAIATLKAANGIPVTVGLQADLDADAKPSATTDAKQGPSSDSKLSAAQTSKMTPAAPGTP
jgi:L,D-transpeptidase ErfK/SrfK